MGKKELSDEKIMEFLKDGWRFHTKESNNRMYITTRRKQEMKSHGRFSRDYWERIRQIEEQYESNAREEVVDASQQEDASTRHRRIYRAKNQLLRNLVIDRGTVKNMSCVHIEDSFCTKWMYTGESFTSIIMRELFRPGVEYIRKISDNDSDKWIMRANQEYCSGCTMFEPRLSGKNYDFKWYLELN